jgi:putative tricarboxylic transport membrane protein
VVSQDAARIEGGDPLKVVESLKTVDARFTCVLALIGALSVIFIDHLIGQPKVMFGRSLTAIPASLFPTWVIVGMVVFGVAVLIQFCRNPQDEDGDDAQIVGLGRGAAFFAILGGYALTMEPLGFFAASALSIAMVSWLVGNRSALQIAALSVSAPVLLYNVATRLLAVSLPELDVIERAYASIFQAVF